MRAVVVVPVGRGLGGVSGWGVFGSGGGGMSQVIKWGRGVQAGEGRWQHVGGGSVHVGGGGCSGGECSGGLFRFSVKGGGSVGGCKGANVWGGESLTESFSNLSLGLETA